MPCIDLKVKVQDTVIQQVLSTSLILPLPMMEDAVVRAIVKANVQKEIMQPLLFTFGVHVSIELGNQIGL